MADITNAQAVRVANEKIRPLADRMAQLDNFIGSLVAEGTAENWPALFPNTADLVADGSAVDGRAPISGADVQAIINAATSFRAFMAANSNAIRYLMLRAAVNPERY